MTQLKKLDDIFVKKFSNHKKRMVQNTELTYVSIDQILNRLNVIHNEEFIWDFINVNHDIQYIKNEAEKGQSLGKTLGYVVLKGTLIIKNLANTIVFSRDGVGADKWLYYNKFGYLVDDLDKSMKTAYAEAIKKAAYTLGVALYLWDEDERKALDIQNDPNNEKSNSTNKNIFTTEQKTKMKNVKNTFSIKKDNDLNKYIEYWVENNKGRKEKTFNDINSNNIDEFCDYIIKHGHNVVPF